MIPYQTALVPAEEIHATLSTFGLNKFQQDERVIPEAEKEKALAKVDLIIAWQNYRNSQKNKANADKDFFEQYNANLLDKKIFKILGKINKKTVYRWQKTWLDNNKDWQVLVNSYCFGSSNMLYTTLSTEEKYALLKYMLHQNRFKLSRAYELIKRDFARQGITQISSLSAYSKVWRWICNNYSDRVEFARGGMKQALDTKLPFVIRDNSVINMGDVLVGDGHTLDFMVINPKTGKPCRATLVGFLDLASRDLVGFEIMLTENTQCIASALRNAIINMGKIPKIVQLDNGRAFKGKTFTGCDFSSEGISGIYAKLGIQTYFSKPYNGREKVIERFFKELTESCAKTVDSYIGNNIANKPAYMQRNEKYHRSLRGDFVPTIEQAKAIIDTWLNEVYRQRTCLNDNNMTIAEYFSANKGTGVDIDLLDDLMMCSKPHVINRNGIKLFNEFYYAPELTGLNFKVIARYSLFDLSYIKVYTTKNEYICKAQRVKKVHPFAEYLGSPEDVAELKAQQKRIAKIKKERLAETKKVLNNLYKDKYCKKVTYKPIEEIKQSQTKSIGINNYEHDDDEYKIDYSIYAKEEPEEYTIDYSIYKKEEPEDYSIYGKEAS